MVPLFSPFPHVFLHELECSTTALKPYELCTNKRQIIENMIPVVVCHGPGHTKKESRHSTRGLALGYPSSLIHPHPPVATSSLQHGFLHPRDSLSTRLAAAAVSERSERMAALTRSLGHSVTQPLCRLYRTRKSLPILVLPVACWLCPFLRLLASRRLPTHTHPIYICRAARDL